MSEQLLEKPSANDGALVSDIDNGLLPTEPSDNKDKKPNKLILFFKKLSKYFHSKTNYIILTTIIGLLFVLGVTLFPVSYWYRMNYAGVEFKDLLMILTAPKEGTDSGMVTEIMATALPYTLAAAAIYIELAILLANRRRICKYIRSALCIVCAATLVSSLIFTADAIGLKIDNLDKKTKFYENYYIDPNSVAITADGKTKNLIHIYLESMENTHSSKEYGGDTDVNYIPNLTKLALENVNFSSSPEGKVGGFLSLPGTGWTMAALLCSTSGVPFAFSIEGNNNMDKREEFAPGLTTLGEILEARGYKNMFLCGSDANFGGRLKYFTQHGNYEIYDLNTARSQGKLPSSLYHNGFWGFEDHYLYDIAKEQLTELAANGQPFNFTMLTVDTHPREGFICSLCGSDHEAITGNVLECADKQVYAFVEWIKQQDFYEDSVIVISGDHLRMDMALVPDPAFDRRVYNCYINAAVTPSSRDYGRTPTTADIFPTTLAAMGFTIEGNRLGLGTNMFSDVPTLSEEIGYAYIYDELLKGSDYYFYKFEHPELTWSPEEEETQ